MTNKFGIRLRELRLEKGLNQRELADIFATGKSSISNYEKNNRLPDAETIIQYASYFNVTVDYMLGISNSKKPINQDIANPLDLASSTIYKFFTERVKNLMFQLDLTAESLSKKLGISKVALTEYILGSKFPAPKLLKKISILLNTTTEYLIGADDNPKIDSFEGTGLSNEYIEVLRFAQENNIPAKVLNDFLKLYTTRGE